jgi:hypothetical protein
MLVLAISRVVDAGVVVVGVDMRKGGGDEIVRSVRREVFFSSFLLSLAHEQGPHRRVCGAIILWPHCN